VAGQFVSDRRIRRDPQRPFWGAPAWL